MNWFLMLLSAVAGGVATWFWSVRKVRRQLPVYGSEQAPAAAATGLVATDDTSAEATPTAETATTVDASVSGVAAFVGSTDGVVGDDSSGVSADSDVSAAAVSVPAAPTLVGEQGVLSGLEAAAPVKGTNARGATAGAPSPKRKPRTKKKAAAPAGVTEPAEDVAIAVPAEVATLVGDPANPHGWTIKGNAKSGLYHAPASPWYGRTIAEAWFQTEQAAEAAGFIRWDRRQKK